jgi:hypothetical protein
VRRCPYIIYKPDRDKTSFPLLLPAIFPASKKTKNLATNGGGLLGSALENQNTAAPKTENLGSGWDKLNWSHRLYGRGINYFSI